MLRRAVSAESDLGVKVKEIMDRGELVSDDIINELVRIRLREPDARQGFVLDGYPRNPAQAKFLDEVLDEDGAKLDRVVKFRVTGDEIHHRLASRRVCPVCNTVYQAETHPPKVEGRCDLDGAELVERKDDSLESIETRLEEYGSQTKQLYEFYSDRGLLVDVDAIGSTNDVFQRLIEALGR